MKEFSIRKFVEEGYLQEVNRQFFHPLGLALAVDVDNWKLSHIICTDDSEGIIFAPGMIDSKKAHRILKKQIDCCKRRFDEFGWDRQPLNPLIYHFLDLI